MQTTTRNDPIALLAIFALLFVAFYVNIVQLTPQSRTPSDHHSGRDADARAPNARAGRDGCSSRIPPAEVMPAAAPAPIEDSPVSLDAAPVIDPQNGAGEVAPIEARDLPILQATIEAPAIDTTLNNPDLNGGNVAPDGCPFPIVNGVCANGVLAKSIDESLFGQKSIADASNDPQHATKARSR